MERRSVFQKIAAMLVVFGGFLMAGGCASKGTPPVDKITNVERAINAAREENAIVHATLELRLAEENLKKARTAISEEDYEKASRLADEALADARYAEAKSRSDKTKKLAQEMRDSIDTLRREIERAEQSK